MAMLLSLPITTALTSQRSAPLQLRDGPCESIALQANFTYGSGGTTATAWVQTSFDDGATWSDVANFSFTTASGRAAQNVSALTAILAATSLTSGSLASNTATSGLIGGLWSVLYTTTGTYAGGTVLRIDAQPNRGRLVLR